MTTPSHGNLPESSAKLPDSAAAAFEASGLSPEEADRLAAAFKPSWEFDEAPFAEGGALRNGDLEALEASGEAREVHGHFPDSARSHTVPAHVPPARVETHEPEVSVIIDRSITAAQVEAKPPVAPAPVAAPFALPAVSPKRVVAPVARSRFNADESLELPSALKKSNKGLFIGLGAAVTAAVLVFAVRAAMSSPDEPSPAAASAAAVSTAAATAPPRATAFPPPPAAIPAPPAAPVQAAPQVAPAAAPSPHLTASPAPKPASHAAPPPHHAAPPPPRNPPKPASGGIVRDVPF